VTSTATHPDAAPPAEQPRQTAADAVQAIAAEATQVHERAMQIRQAPGPASAG
jgi:hypothetical protein